MIYPRTMLSREGWYYLLVLGLVFGGAMVREINLLLVLAGLLLGPLLFNWRTVVATLRGLKVCRRVPETICAGDLLVAQLSLENTRKRLGSWAVVVEDEVRPQPAGARQRPMRPGVLFAYVAPGQVDKGVYRGRLVRRGRYRLGPLRISTRFPFGLFSRTLVVDQPATVTVFPRLGRLTRAWAARKQVAFAGTQRRQRQPGPEGDFFGLRQWQRGDSRRWIHWRSFAHSGRLVVRVFEQPRHRDVAVLLDLWQPPRPSPAQLDHVELAVSFVATVLADLCRKGGSQLHLGVCDPSPAGIRGPASAALLNDMMHRLAVAEAQADDGLPALLEAALAHCGAGTEVIIVSTRPVELTDADRFACLWADPARRRLAPQVRSIDTSSQELAQYFQAE